MTSGSSSKSIVARRCIVRGRVQGVYYRATARQKAAELNLSGQARNLPDHTVEVLIIGPPDRVQAMIDWLWIGSPSSHVTGVDVEDVDIASLANMPVGFGTS